MVFNKGAAKKSSHNSRNLNGTLKLKLIVIIVLCAFGVLILYVCFSSLMGPVGGDLITEEVIQVKPGMSAAEIGNLLSQRKLIRSVLMFRIASKINGTSRSLKAGEYALSRDMNTLQILHKMASGEAALYSFTIPEGTTLSQIAGYWEEREFGTIDDFTEALQDPEIRRKHGINVDSLEGYLFPDTYKLPRGISEQKAIDKMLTQFEKNTSDLMGGEISSESVSIMEKSFSLHEIISLASIIEREAGVEEEKPVISAVFHNRLRRGQKLESCATVLYILGYPRRKLTLEDLSIFSPYNTYISEGLPPGPICNPGRGSIVAALRPSGDRYLYFVSNNDGTHYFTESYDDFLNAKRRYKDGYMGTQDD